MRSWCGWTFEAVRYGDVTRLAWIRSTSGAATDDATAAHGAITVGPDWRVLIATFVLLMGVTSTFAGGTSTSSVRSVLAVLLATAATVLLLKCALTDPGVVPPQPVVDCDVPMTVVSSERLPSGGIIEVERRWCVACNLYRPPRTNHCRFCGTCILRRDHHCPWTGTCVGRRNYKWYYWFIVLTFAASLAVAASAALDFSGRVQRIGANANAQGVALSSASLLGRAAWETKMVEPLVFVICCLGAVLVGSLVRYHTYLSMHDLTTVEHAKSKPPQPCMRRRSLLGSWWLRVASDDVGPSLLSPRSAAALHEALALSVGNPPDAFGVQVVETETERDAIAAAPP